MPDQNTGTTRASNQRASQKQLVGISFPFRKEDGEFPKRVRDVECVQDDFNTLFKTPIRSRVMRPGAGHSAYQAVFDSQGPLLNARLQRIIRQAQQNNEPRVRIRGIAVTESNTEVDADVVYEVKGVRDTASLPTMSKLG